MQWPQRGRSASSRAGYPWWCASLYDCAHCYLAVHFIIQTRISLAASGRAWAILARCCRCSEEATEALSSSLPCCCRSVKLLGETVVSSWETRALTSSLPNELSESAPTTANNSSSARRLPGDCIAPLHHSNKQSQGLSNGKRESSNLDVGVLGETEIERGKERRDLVSFLKLLLLSESLRRRRCSV
eukprot:11475-Heterococcus_DN1.PRE.6